MKAEPRYAIMLASGVFVFSSSFLFTVSEARASASICPYTWTRTLKIGSTGEDVLKLQQFLNSDDTTRVATEGAGSVGQETTRYGAMTALAVSKFQEKYADEILIPNALSQGTGLLGSMTRSKVNALCAASVSLPSSSAVAPTAPLPVSTSSTLLVTPGQQPPLTLAPSNALYVPFTNMTLTAGGSDVTVNSITVQRVGPSDNRAFAGLDLLDEEGTVLSYATLNSNHQAVFKDPFTIPAGSSLRVSVTGEMDDLTDYDGEVAGFNVVAIDASAPLSGELPFRGSFLTLNSNLAIGSPTVRLSPEDPQQERTRYVNDTNIRFSAIRITADSHEDVRLHSISWEQSGSAGAADVANVSTVVNGTSYPATLDGRIYTSTFGDGIVIKKGMSLDAYISGDLTILGSNRTVEFDIRTSGDVYITGESYHFGLALAAEANTDVAGAHSAFITTDGTTDGDEGTPFFSGSVVTISPGAFVSIGR